jgi:hypothetical protein
MPVMAASGARLAAEIASVPVPQAQVEHSVTGAQTSDLEQPVLEPPLPGRRPDDRIVKACAETSESWDKARRSLLPTCHYAEVCS